MEIKYALTQLGIFNYRYTQKPTGREVTSHHIINTDTQMQASCVEHPDGDLNVRVRHGNFGNGQLVYSGYSPERAIAVIVAYLFPKA